MSQASVDHSFYCTIIGGPNGSGKSTIYDRVDLPGEFINADNIAKRLASNSAAAGNILAGRIAVKLISEKIENKESFVFETTLSSAHSLDVMRSASANGYEVGLVFVALESPELNILRVANRVLKGGHDIPDDVIRRRYDKSLENLPPAIASANRVHIFDNSGEEPAHVVSIDYGRISHLGFDADNIFHARLAASVAHALHIDTNDLLHGRFKTRRRFKTTDTAWPLIFRRWPITLFIGHGSKCVEAPNSSCAGL